MNEGEVKHGRTRSENGGLSGTNFQLAERGNLFHGQLSRNNVRGGSYMYVSKLSTNFPAKLEKRVSPKVHIYVSKVSRGSVTYVKVFT